jgi:hypothetical protein
VSIRAIIAGPARNPNAVRVVHHGIIDATSGGLRVSLDDGRGMRLTLDDELARAELALTLLRSIDHGSQGLRDALAP